MKKIIEQFNQRKQQQIKSLAVLVDPDYIENEAELLIFLTQCSQQKVDFFFVGGSLIMSDNFAMVVRVLKANSDIPVILFPGNHFQIDANADALLLLSLISGRNPELLIGQHVLAAPVLKQSKLEILPVGYILVNSGLPTSVSYMSNTTPIPADKPTIAACTAMAGEMLGLRTIYLEAGSGAINPVSQKMISNVARATNLPLIVGGGLNSIKRVMHALEAGADTIVIGNSLERKFFSLEEIVQVVQKFNKASNVH